MEQLLLINEGSTLVHIKEDMSVLVLVFLILPDRVDGHAAVFPCLIILLLSGDKLLYITSRST